MKLLRIAGLLALTLVLPAAPAAGQEGPADRFYDCVAEPAYELRDSPRPYRAFQFAYEAERCAETYASAMVSPARAQQFLTCVGYATDTYWQNGAADVFASTLLYCRTSYTGWPIGKLPPPPPKGPALSGSARGTLPSGRPEAPRRARSRLRLRRSRGDGPSA